MKLYQAIAQNWRLFDSPEHAEHAQLRHARIVELLPSGSGFDNGSKIESVNDSRIVLSTSFHHMNEHGFYCGWTEHKIYLRASIMHGFTLRISGHNYRDIKDYIADVFNTAMNADFDWMQK